VGKNLNHVAGSIGAGRETVDTPIHHCPITENQRVLLAAP
jgi:hypothetical protein